MTTSPETPCTACGKPTRARNVFVTMWLGAELNVIDDVPAHVCDACGLQFYDAPVEEQLRGLMSEGFPAHKASHRISVPVFRLDGSKPDLDSLTAARQFQARQEAAQS